MIIDCSTNLVSMNKDLHKGNEKVEHEPVVHHLDAGSLGQGLAHPHEHGGQHQHHRQVHRHHRLEEERLEVVGGVADDVEEDGGHVDGHEGSYESSSKNHLHLYCVIILPQFHS